LDKIKNFLKKYKEIILPLVFGAILYYINSNFLRFIFQVYPPTLNWTIGKGTWWLTQPPLVKFSYVVVFAPWFEEVLFRRGVLQWFTNKDRFKIGLMISSIMFGLWHMLFGWGWMKGLDMMVVGVVFGLIYRKYGFRGSLLAHYVNNLLAMIYLLGLV